MEPDSDEESTTQFLLLLLTTAAQVTSALSSSSSSTNAALPADAIPPTTKYQGPNAISGQSHSFAPIIASLLEDLTDMESSDDQQSIPLTPVDLSLLTLKNLFYYPSGGNSALTLTDFWHSCE
ncbi:hypothetical protein PAXRUDRAFT_20781 [Paxillus rubicundulus Ve08.2h10]|uniref:Uncharacterized protein n=1 Tax=Paxillus rubicundulus Ve08.2h10 TaxID=930991 RepID=A0A0D0BPP8_9AGAM|nr:hypothetical protein PAXRUDRAFT_20781 [Paxillus rubicundulus Ve08.2h10]